MATSGTILITRVGGLAAVVSGLLLILTAVHILMGLFALFQRPDEEDEFELELPDKWRAGLAKLVERVAEERGLDAPDVIRPHAESLAHVDTDRDGDSVLCVGGSLIALLPQQALAGVIAHERPSPPATPSGRGRSSIGTASCCTWKIGS